jgi:hypothetical protein
MPPNISNKGYNIKPLGNNKLIRILNKTIIPKIVNSVWVDLLIDLNNVFILFSLIIGRKSLVSSLLFKK